jgi:hypothetical protein
MEKDKGKVPEGGADFMKMKPPYSFSPVQQQKANRRFKFIFGLAWLWFGGWFTPCLLTKPFYSSVSSLKNQLVPVIEAGAPAIRFF